MVREGNKLIPAFPKDKKIRITFKGDNVVTVKIFKLHSQRQKRVVFAIAKTALSNAPDDMVFVLSVVSCIRQVKT